MATSIVKVARRTTQRGAVPNVEAVERGPAIRRGRAPFCQIPDFVYDSDVLRPLDVRVFCVLDRHANRERVCWPGRETLAREAKCSPRTLDASLARLREGGAIRVTARYRRDTGTGSVRQTSNLYELAVIEPFPLSERRYVDPGPESAT